MNGLWQTGRGVAHVIFQKDLPPAAAVWPLGGPRLLQRSWAAKTRLSTPGCVLRDSWHPEAGIQVGVWDQRGTLGRLIAALPAGLAEASWGVGGGVSPFSHSLCPILLPPLPSAGADHNRHSAFQLRSSFQN